jgi:hypothetical protein
MQSTFKIEREMKSIKRWLLFFIIVLVISGITASPAEWELAQVVNLFDEDTKLGSWLHRIYFALQDTSKKYPYLFYGYDWLAFAHVVIAIAFIGPYKDPVRNKWVVEFGAIACLLIIPFALIAGYMRGIPFWWRMIDCSFGIIGLIPIGICYNKITSLEEVMKTEVTLEQFI